jgi:hypothetical protein
MTCKQCRGCGSEPAGLVAVPAIMPEPWKRRMRVLPTTITSRSRSSRGTRIMMVPGRQLWQCPARCSCPVCQQAADHNDRSGWSPELYSTLHDRILVLGQVYCGSSWCCSLLLVLSLT